MHQPIYHFLSSSFLLFFQTSIWDHFPSIWMYTFEVPLVEVCSLHTLSFYLFECLYFTLVLRKIFTEWTLLGWYCFLSAHWSYYSTYFWLSMLMLKSQSLIYVSFLFSLAAFFDFALIFDILQFHYDVLQYRFPVSFLGFIEIPESVNWCLS